MCGRLAQVRKGRSVAGSSEVSAECAVDTLKLQASASITLGFLSVVHLLSG